ncbi:TetR/AcrR family transcriptional regulator [Solihabitans fulvus]|uniref:TetR/AcrR family transcriptional regulator n=1 Tax=Solihabitans fulvus TaxID=1892852 RepID=A0A5B2WU47_9PSEU|nr:TetR/AcrR family transcriptional regulator [Solihabitans fulvus]KAA2253949.1 TetR/AcrR family transcriptional regulator [Solihabitans fulvus]
MATRARERLLDAAEELFYAEGVRAVGVERILDVSGVGRASFYRHFTSKDDLLVEVLQIRDRQWRAWLSGTIDGWHLPPGQRPLAVFDALAERFSRDDFRGCAFINTMVELADRTSAAHGVAAQHKQKVIDYLDTILAAAGHADHEATARQLALLVDGAIVTALREGTPDAALRAKEIARAILASAR